MWNILISYSNVQVTDKKVLMMTNQFLNSLLITNEKFNQEQDLSISTYLSLYIYKASVSDSTN